MDSFLLQKQIKDNAADLQDFCKDLKEWGEQTKLEEQKRKNPQKVLEKNVTISSDSFCAFWDTY